MSTTSSGRTALSLRRSKSSATSTIGAGASNDLSFEAHGEHWFALLQLLSVASFTPQRETYRRRVAATPIDDAGASANASASASESDVATREEWNFDALIVDVHLQLDATDKRAYGAKLFDELYSFQPENTSREEYRKKFYAAAAKAWEVRKLVGAVITKRDAAGVWIATRQGKMNGQEENTPHGTLARQITLGLHWFGLRDMFESVLPGGKKRPLNQEVYYDQTTHKWDFCGMIEDIYIHLDRRQPKVVGERLVAELARLHPDLAVDTSRLYSESEQKWDIISLVRLVMPLRDPATRERTLAAAAAAAAQSADVDHTHKTPPFASQDNPEEAQTHNGTGTDAGVPSQLQTPPTTRGAASRGSGTISPMEPAGAGTTPAPPPPRYTGDLNKPAGSKSRSRRSSDDRVAMENGGGHVPSAPTGNGVASHPQTVLAHAFVSPESSSSASPPSNRDGASNLENHYKEEDQKAMRPRPDLTDPRMSRDMASADNNLPECFSSHNLPHRSSPPSVRSLGISSRRSSLSGATAFPFGVTSPTMSADIPVSAQTPPVTSMHALASHMHGSDIHASVNSKVSPATIFSMAAAGTRSRGTSRDSQSTSATASSFSREPTSRAPHAHAQLEHTAVVGRMQRTAMPTDSQMTWPGAPSAEDFAESSAPSTKPPVTRGQSQGLPASHPHHPHNMMARIRRMNAVSRQRPSSAYVGSSRHTQNGSLTRSEGSVSEYGSPPGPITAKNLSPAQITTTTGHNTDERSVNTSFRVKPMHMMGSRVPHQKYGTIQSSSLTRPISRQTRSGSKYGTSGPIDMSAARRIHQHQAAAAAAAGAGGHAPAFTSMRSTQSEDGVPRGLGISEKGLRQREFNAAQENAKLLRELEKLKQSNSLLQQQRTQYTAKLKQAEDRNHKLQNRLQDVVGQHSRRSQSKLNFKLIEPLKSRRRGGGIGSGGNLTPPSGGRSHTRGRSATPAGHGANGSGGSGKRSSEVFERRGRSVGVGARKRKSLPALDLVLPPATTSFGADGGALSTRTPFAATPSDRDAISVASKILETYEYQIKQLKAENAKLRDTVTALNGSSSSSIPAATPTTHGGRTSRSSSMSTATSAANTETFLASASKTHSRSPSMKSPPAKHASAFTTTTSPSNNESKENAALAAVVEKNAALVAVAEKNAELVESLRAKLKSRKKEISMATEIEELLTEERNELRQTVDRLRAEIDKLKRRGRSGAKRRSAADSAAGSGRMSPKDSESSRPRRGNAKTVEHDDVKSSEVAAAAGDEEQGDTTSENARQTLRIDIRDVKVENSRHAITKLRTELDDVVADARAAQVKVNAKLQGVTHGEERVLSARIESNAQKMRFNQLSKSYIDLQALLKSSERKVDALTKQNLELAKREADMDSNLIELRERYDETLEELHDKARSLTHTSHERDRALEELRMKAAAYNELSERHEAFREMHENDDTGSVSSLELLPNAPLDGIGEAENLAALTSEEILEQIREVRAKIAAARDDQVDLDALTHHQQQRRTANTNANALSAAFDASFGHASQASSPRSSVEAAEAEDPYGGVQIPPAVQLALLRQLEARIGRPLTDEEIGHLRRLHTQLLSSQRQGATANGAMTPEMIHQMVDAFSASASTSAGAAKEKSTDRPTSAPPARAPAGVHQSSMRRRMSIPERRGACGTTTCGGGRRRPQRPTTRDDGYVGTTCSREKCIVM